MKKMSAATILALCLVLILGSTVVYAHIAWCPDDPVLSIGGTEVHVIIEIPAGSGELVSGAVLVKVHVPENVVAYVSEYGGGFGHGEEVEFIPDGEPVEAGDEVWINVEVKVPATEELRVRMTVEAPGVSQSRKGWSNEWVQCRAKLEIAEVKDGG